LLKGFGEGIHFTTKEMRVVFDTTDYPEADRVKMYLVGNLVSKNYAVLVSPRLSSFPKLLYIILKYDPFGLPGHLLSATRRFLRRIKKKL
jgi:hypothetical protein